MTPSAGSEMHMERFCAELDIDGSLDVSEDGVSMSLDVFNAIAERLSSPGAPSRVRLIAQISPYLNREFNACDVVDGLLAALAGQGEPPEPVAWRYRWLKEDGSRSIWFLAERSPGVPVAPKGVRYEIEPLYATPTAREAQTQGDDGLDNRRANIRLCTKSLNGANTGHHVSKSGYRGVYQSGRRWTARICRNGREVSLGSFDNREDAARAYNEAAREAFGEFATLNKVVP